MEGRLLLNVVVRKSAAILKLLASEDEALLVGRNALLVLDLGLDIVNGVGGLDLEGDGLAGQGLDKDLHTSTKTKDEMKGRLLLDIVVGKSSPILQLLSSEDQTLLVRGDSFLVLDLGLHIVDGVGRLNLKSNGLAGQGLDEDLHTTTETEHYGMISATVKRYVCEPQLTKVKGRLLLDIVIR